MSLLSIVQNATDRIGTGSRPASVINNTDPTTRQLLALSTQMGKELVRRFEWPALMTEKTFSTVAQSVQTDVIPSDWARFVNDSMFNRTTNRKVIGPLGAQDWQREQANPSVSTVYSAFRVRGTDLLLTPTPPAGQTVAYEYISANWCRSAAGTAQAAWAADTDTGILDEELMTLGLEKLFKEKKGLETLFEDADFMAAVEHLLGAAGGAPTLRLNNRPLVRPSYLPNIPDGSWPS